MEVTTDQNRWLEFSTSWVALHLTWLTATLRTNFSLRPLSSLGSRMSSSTTFLHALLRLKSSLDENATAYPLSQLYHNVDQGWCERCQHCIRIPNYIKIMPYMAAPARRTSAVLAGVRTHVILVPKQSAFVPAHSSHRLEYQV